MRPVVMPPNRLDHFYLGGAKITDLRGVPATSERSPEEWLASTTTRFGDERTGLSALPDGSLLRDAVAADPNRWLGASHQRGFGGSTGLLVKLLDAGQRLPVHLHPDRTFAARHLDCSYGKTEAWYVIDAEPGAVCHLGFGEDVSAPELAHMVAEQDTKGMLTRMRTMEVTTGDGILVPAGLPHAIGAGIFVVEAQEPTDQSILLEWVGLPLDGERDGHLRLGFPTALDAVDRRGWASDDLEALRLRPSDSDTDDDLIELLPAASTPFFRVQLAAPRSTPVEVEAGFAVAVVLAGEGSIHHQAEATDVQRGDVVAVPYAAGRWGVSGTVRVVVCRPGADGPAGVS